MTTTGIRRRNGRLAIVIAILLVATAGCGSDEDEGGADPGGAAKTEVVMELVAFTPDQLEVPAGTTVTWRNRDVGAHTVTSGTVEQGGSGVTTNPDDTFDSGEVSKDDTFEQAFAEPGTYPYFCSLHPATMRGEIRVTDPEGD